MERHTFLLTYEIGDLLTKTLIHIVLQIFYMVFNEIMKSYKLFKDHKLASIKYPNTYKH